MFNPASITSKAGFQKTAEIRNQKRGNILGQKRDKNLKLSEAKSIANLTSSSIEEEVSIKYGGDGPKSVVKHQPKIGPEKFLDKKQKEILASHYSHGEKSFFKRLSQYNGKREFHVKMAESLGRPLTEQERGVKDGVYDSKSISINHVVSAGCFQNMVNCMTVQVVNAKEKIKEILNEAKPLMELTDDELLSRQQGLSRAVLDQVQGIGRVRGVGRAMIQGQALEDGYDYKSFKNKMPESSNSQKKDPIDIKYQMLLDDSVAALDKGSYPAYKGIHKNTVDGSGNVRLGYSRTNFQIGAGIDPPLTADGKPEAWGWNVAKSWLYYGVNPKEREDPMSSFTYTVTGEILSSSRAKSSVK